MSLCVSVRYTSSLVIIPMVSRTEVAAAPIRLMESSWTLTLNPSLTPLAARVMISYRCGISFISSFLQNVSWA